MSDAFADFSKQALTSPEDLSRLGKPSWIYRGQRDASWLMETSLERCCARHKVPAADRARVEFGLNREFRRAYHQYAAHVPDAPCVVEWLALMQHYGAPTRLLDFTYSIYIAAYFAVENTDSVSAIWAVNSTWAMNASMEALSRIGKDQAQVDALGAPFLEGSESVFLDLAMTPPFAQSVTPINPFRLNERLRIQRGVFLAPTDLSPSFMDNIRAMPDYGSDQNVLMITISPDIAESMRGYLFDINITRRSLFPGLDGYAQALGVYHPVFNPAEPHGRRLAAVREFRRACGLGVEVVGPVGNTGAGRF